MSTIFIDLDSVVFEPSKDVINKAAVEKYGHPKADFLIAFHGLGIFNNYVSQKISGIAYQCLTGLSFRPGAKEALDYLTSVPECSIEFCSKVDFVDKPDVLEDYYRQKANCMNKIQNYHFASANKHTTSIFSRAIKNATIIYVVAGDLESVKNAKIQRFQPVLISQKKRDRKKARIEYGAYCFKTLKLFQEFVTNQK